MSEIRGANVSKTCHTLKHVENLSQNGNFIVADILEG